ncbi:hypothetical protein H8D64_01395 [PVC group bacterium]|nr:hypothetical protein [PVC group bacterium]
MRIANVFIVTGVLSLTCLSTLAQAPTYAEQEMLRKLHEIHSVVLELKSEIAELKKEIQEEEEDEDFGAFVSRSGFQTRKADSAKLRKIKLPKDPSEDQIKDYIQDIMEASRGQNSFSSDDPQVRMLLKVGAENLNLLIDAMSNNERMPGFFGGNYHVQEAILLLANEDHKKLILDSLAWQTFLVKVVLNNGWEKDAKEILLDELASAPNSLPSEWIQAVANLKDPETYDDLKWYLINRRNRHNTFQAIEHLPDIDLEETVAKAWEQTGIDEWEERGIAQIAIQYGHENALEYLVDFLENDKQNSYNKHHIRRLVLQHLNFYGSNKEIMEWLKKNTGKLTFDKETKKFIVAHEGKTSENKDAAVE